MKNYLQKDKEFIINLKNAIDYSEISMITLNNEKTVYIMRINGSNSEKKYLGIQKIDNEVSAIGIYNSKSISYVERVIKSGKLPKNESVLLTSLSGQPIIEWETLANDKSVVKIAKSGAIITSSFQNNKQSSSQKKRRLY